MSKVIINKLRAGEEKHILPVEKDEEMIFVLLGFESGEKEVVIELKDEGARAQILGLFILHEGEIKVRTMQHHQAPNTTSDLLFKTILLGAARFDYKGLIKIDKAAQGANAYQRNDNLLLPAPVETSMETAGPAKPQVITQPILEIEANEVRCTHGATVGQLDEEQLFYLTTRGLSRQQATRLLLEGFMGQVIERIPRGAEADKVKELVWSKMEERDI